MKKHWDIFFDDMENFQEAFSEFLNSATFNNTDKKRAIQITRTWEKAVHSANNFSKYVSPVEAVAVKYPESEKFIESWTFWKEYLAEQHGIVMKSRFELKALERLFKITKDNVNKAIELIDLACQNGWKNIYLPDPNQPSKPQKGQDYDPDAF